MIVTETHSSDRRYKRIIPTEEAISLSECIHDKIEKIKEQLFEGISSEQEYSLDDIIKVMIQNIS